MWDPLSDCPTPADALVPRTAGSKSYDAKLYGNIAELWFFLMKKRKERSCSHLFPCPNGPIYGTLGSGFLNQDDNQTCGPERNWQCVLGIGFTLLLLCNRWCVLEFWSRCETVGIVSCPLSAPVSVHICSWWVQHHARSRKIRVSKMFGLENPCDAQQNILARTTVAPR